MRVVPGALRLDVGVSTLPTHDYATLLRSAMLRSHELIGATDADELLARVLQDSVELLGATVARFRPLIAVEEETPGGGAPPSVLRPAPAVALPALAAEMEESLLPRAIDRRRPLLSSHPRLDEDLAGLAEKCGAAGITVQAIPLRTAGTQMIGVVVLHWLGAPRPSALEQQSVFAAYWRAAQLALAGTLERIRLGAELSALEITAFRDRLTGLANAEALERRLDRHTGTWPLSVLVLDFDGMREANTAYGFRDGGDALIRAVGQALAGLALDDEVPARMHTAGDEFALLLPGQDATAAQRRRDEVEAALDELDVPTQFDAIYGGASVGAASRQPGETPGQVLGRAIAAMRARKQERQERRRGGRADA